MKSRQQKKLSKKAASLYPRSDFKFCFDASEGLFIHEWRCSFECNEWDWCSAWDLVKDVFITEHTAFDNTGMEYTGPKITTINVLRWLQSGAPLSQNFSRRAT